MIQWSRMMVAICTAVVLAFRVALVHVGHQAVIMPTNWFQYIVFGSGTSISIAEKCNGPVGWNVFLSLISSLAAYYAHAQQCLTLLHTLFAICGQK